MAKTHANSLLDHTIAAVAWNTHRQVTEISSGRMGYFTFYSGSTDANQVVEELTLTEHNQYTLDIPPEYKHRDLLASVVSTKRYKGI